MFSKAQEPRLPAQLGVIATL